jgi:GlpG protein
MADVPIGEIGAAPEHVGQRPTANGELFSVQPLMRQVATLADEVLARRFGDYLRSLGIQAKTETASPAIPSSAEGTSSEARYEVWVFDEDRVAEARGLFAEFQVDPQSGRFSIDPPGPMWPSIPRPSQLTQLQPGRLLDGGRAVEAGGRGLSWTVAALAVVVYLAGLWHERRNGNAGEWSPLARRLTFRPIDAAGREVDASPLAPSEPWRWVTPIFVHRHFLPLGFNLALWLGLALYFEPRRGGLRLFLLMIVTGIVSNITQDAWPLRSAAAFGGLAGVNFGLMGYLWVKSLTDRRSGLELPANLVMFSFVILTVTLMGLIPGASAGGPLGGMVAGGLLGYTPRRKSAIDSSGSGS